MLCRKVSELCILLVFLCALQTEGYAGEVFDRELFSLGKLKEGFIYTFRLTISNISGDDLNIIKVEPSCGCVEIREFSSRIGAGEAGFITFAIDTTGKIGKIAKILDIRTDNGPSHELKLTSYIEHDGKTNADSSIIFRGRCRKCHVGESSHFTTGRELYDSLCYICHKDNYPGSGLQGDELLSVISRGLAGTSMPGFLVEHGGPLTVQQAGIIVEYLKGFDKHLNE